MLSQVAYSMPVEAFREGKVDIIKRTKVINYVPPGLTIRKLFQKWFDTIVLLWLVTLLIKY